MPVYDETNEFIGFIEDILITKQGSTFGFRIDQKGLFLRDGLIPASHLLHVRGDKIIITKTKLLPLAKSSGDCYPLNKMLNKRLVTPDDELIGIVKDVYFSSDLGMVEIIEMTEGWFTDLQEGRKYLAWNDVNYDGKETLITNLLGGGASDEMPKLYEQKPWENRL